MWNFHTLLYYIHFITSFHINTIKEGWIWKNAISLVSIKPKRDMPPLTYEFNLNITYGLLGWSYLGQGPYENSTLNYRERVSTYREAIKIWLKPRVGREGNQKIIGVLSSSLLISSSNGTLKSQQFETKPRLFEPNFVRTCKKSIKLWIISEKLPELVQKSKDNWLSTTSALFYRN